MSTVSNTSLTPIGKPCSRPSLGCASSARARAMAPSKSTWVKACTAGSRSRMRAMQSARSACAVISRRASFTAASVAERRFSSLISETPFADQFGKDHDRLLDTVDEAVLVRLVRELRLARTENADRDVAVRGIQHRGVGEVRRTARGRRQAEVPPRHAEHLLDPRVSRIGIDRLHVDERRDLDVVAERLRQSLTKRVVLLTGDRADVD